MTNPFESPQQPGWQPPAGQPGWQPPAGEPGWQPPMGQPGARPMPPAPPIRGHNALQEVALAPGSTKTFNMCYEASGHNGVYSFTYDPTFFTTEDKPTWSIELTDE